MNKAELVSHVAAETSTTRAAAERMVGAVFSAIADALARDEPVAIAGFGRFALRSRAAREGRNPRTGEPVAVAASKVPAFKPGKTLRDAVNREHT
ncbi:MAG: HU family DNA-binding protein [Gammaproteobacteria bacterium]|nr:HU family DNA-binding protein [Gammaproteobacteria bacterium]